MPKILLVAEKPAAGRDFAAALTGGHFTGQGPHRGKMADGTERKFINDNDTVIMRGYSSKDGVRVGFGEVITKVLPAKQ